MAGGRSGGDVGGELFAAGAGGVALYDLAEPVGLSKSRQIGLGFLQHGLPVCLPQAENVVSLHQALNVFV